MFNLAQVRRVGETQPGPGNRKQVEGLAGIQAG